jgi:hypothetical protein
MPNLAKIGVTVWKHTKDNKHACIFVDIKEEVRDEIYQKECISLAT